MARNENLYKAKTEKNDEFYTRLMDVVEELKYYKDHFRDKIVFCNCDDPTRSAFWKYFHLNFGKLGLRKLVSTHYDKNRSTYKMEYEGGDDNDVGAGTKTALEGNGDFRDKECLGLLDECDIVVTNPPFSLARSYVEVLMRHEKRFVIIGDLNWIPYKEVFPLLRDNRIWLGYCSVKEFIQPNGSIKKFGNKLWYTNLDIVKRHEMLILHKKYTPEEYPVYDNYDAINVDKVANIPVDYDGVMGVPITFYDKYCPEQIEIVGIACGNSWANYAETLKSLNFNPNIKYGGGLGNGVINGKGCYARILIRKIGQI